MGVCPWASQCTALAHNQAEATKKPMRKIGMTLGKCKGEEKEENWNYYMRDCMHLENLEYSKRFVRSQNIIKNKQQKNLNQPTNQPTYQPTNQPTNLPTNQSTKEKCICSPCLWNNVFQIPTDFLWHVFGWRQIIYLASFFHSESS